MPALSKHPLPAVTMIPEVFLTEYMPQANGDFVKVYLYLLMKSKDPAGQITLTEMADYFVCTENDIQRALRYWEKNGLIQLNYTQGESEATGIELLPVLSAAEKEAKVKADALRISYEARAAVQPAASAPAQISGPIGVSGSRAAELAANEEVQQLIFVSESYFGRPLTSTEVNRILYFYDELHFSSALVEYLVEYCVSKNHANIRYIEKVGLAWHQNGITTVDQARQESNIWEKDYFTILKAFGISNRNPVPSEVDFMNRWVKDYQLPLELILEACHRAAARQASFPYADKILTGWHKKKVKTLEDVRKQDSEHQQKKKEPSVKAEPSEKNRFNNFHQREYNYSDLEKKLLDI